MVLFVSKLGDLWNETCAHASDLARLSARVLETAVMPSCSPHVKTDFGVLTIEPVTSPNFCFSVCHSTIFIRLNLKTDFVKLIFT